MGAKAVTRLTEQDYLDLNYAAEYGSEFETLAMATGRNAGFFFCRQIDEHNFAIAYLREGGVSQPFPISRDLLGSN